MSQPAAHQATAGTLASVRWGTSSAKRMRKTRKRRGRLPFGKIAVCLKVWRKKSRYRWRREAMHQRQAAVAKIGMYATPGTVGVSHSGVRYLRRTRAAKAEFPVDGLLRLPNIRGRDPARERGAKKRIESQDIDREKGNDRPPARPLERPRQDGFGASYHQAHLLLRGGTVIQINLLREASSANGNPGPSPFLNPAVHACRS